MSPFVTPAPQWKRSAHCGASNTCVEVAPLAGPSYVGARDAKNGADGPVLTFSQGEWRGFIARVKRGDHDLE
ncbi:MULTISPECIES: DUF397 domain-containing protein [Actinomadura]|uniref:DUF397 domain-containing protein n=1 Tax=Actinomadura yumaensis TaxID=111807 RepID=A0ABW2CRD6_9ACTN|nr:DUF397 domain-containing protein [Actinomadura sp. J1-007]